MQIILVSTGAMALNLFIYCVSYSFRYIVNDRKMLN